MREHRHLTFDGTLTRDGNTLGYTGVWNRDQDFVTGEIRITGGQFRVDLPSGGTLVGAGCGPTATSSRAPATVS